MFRRDLRHTGVYNAAGAPKFNAVQWKFHTSGRVIVSPAIVNGVVCVGSTDGNFYAIDAGSRTLKWKFETKAWEVSSPWPCLPDSQPLLDAVIFLRDAIRSVRLWSTFMRVYVVSVS